MQQRNWFLVQFKWCGQGPCPSACKRHFVRVSRGRWYWLVVQYHHVDIFIHSSDDTSRLSSYNNTNCSLQPAMCDGRLHQRPPVHYNNVTWQDTSTILQFIRMSHGRIHQRTPVHYNNVTWQDTSMAQSITMSHGRLHQRPFVHYNREKL
jgi:hypothetical protein